MTTEEARALYYPFIEVRDLSWLFSAALFWDEISTITPDTEQPYTNPASRFLADQGILLPYRASPSRQEVVHISQRISALIDKAAFQSVLGPHHWSNSQFQQLGRMYSRMHPDKIESGLLITA